MKLFSDFAHWLWLVIKKWVWLLGLLPILIDYGSAYLPEFPDIRLSWQWTLIFASIGVLISAFLVHQDLTNQLNLYEFHEPLYEFKISDDVKTEICGRATLEIRCAFCMIAKTEWIGHLRQISLNNQQTAPGLGAGKLSRVDYQPLDWHIPNPLNYPYEIPSAGCDFFLTIHYPISGPFTSESEGEWQTAFIDIRLLIGYETQPVGYVEKSDSLKIPVNLGGLLEEAKEIQQQRNQNDATTN